MQSPIFPENLTSRSNFSATPRELILHRGGEELLLEKVGDRMTLSLHPPYAPEQAASELRLELVQAMPSVNLAEFSVPANQLETAITAAQALAGVRFANCVYQFASDPGHFVYLTNQITIQFVESVNAAFMKALAADFGLEILKLVPGVPKAFVFEIAEQAMAEPLQVVQALVQHPEVLIAEPNLVFPIQRFHALHPAQWHLQHHSGDDLVVGSHIDVEAAWAITQGRRSIVVAIADDAIQFAYPSFQGIGKIVAPANFAGISSDSLHAAADSHGTYCAALSIASQGVAPGCALMPLTLGDWLDDQILEQISEWTIAQNAAVLLLGWGAAIRYFPLSLRQRAALTRIATQGRNGKGTVVVVAAGNTNRSIDGAKVEAIAGQVQPDHLWLNGIAVHPDVITVAASTSLNCKAGYSNWGASISVCAPGNPSLSATLLEQTGENARAGRFVTAIVPDSELMHSEQTKPEPTKPEQASQQELDPDEMQALEAGPDRGTSASAAIVAGVAALMLSANPDLTAKQVKQILQDTADRILDQEPDPELELKGGSYNSQGHSLWFGYGKVNAGRAVKVAYQQLQPLKVPTSWIEHESFSPVAIPDGDLRGTTSCIEVWQSDRVWDVEVTVEIEHQFFGDLELYLISPSYQSVLLQNRTLGRTTLLRRTYSLATVPLLKTLFGQPAQGQWQLKAIDYAVVNTGQIKNWSLKLGVA
ncbi:MAG: hypothetical protein Kow00121_07360 [Elainellaceae cyanobacterium]